MKRRHLLEIHDQSWCPSPVRDGITDLLSFYINRTDAFGSVFPRLLEAMNMAESRTIIDLCSGAGGPWPSLLTQIDAADAHIDQLVLTDLYPNIAALRNVQAQAPQRVVIEESSVDVLAVPPRLRGFRTQFNAFHHFKPVQARAILQDAVTCGDGIAIFELAERTLRSIAAMVAVSPLAAYWGPPLLRSKRLSQWLYTYPMPLLPTAFAIDGVVSCLRAYTPTELRALVDQLDAPGYRWEIGTHKGKLFTVTYLIGHPPSLNIH